MLRISSQVASQPNLSLGYILKGDRRSETHVLRLHSLVNIMSWNVFCRRIWRLQGEILSEPARSLLQHLSNNWKPFHNFLLQVFPSRRESGLSKLWNIWKLIITSSSTPALFGAIYFFQLIDCSIQSKHLAKEKCEHLPFLSGTQVWSSHCIVTPSLSPSLLVWNVVKFLGFVKVVSGISLSYFMDISKLLHWFVKVDT